jgi:hypothetical protein
MKRSVFREGDTVRIVSPEVVVRCGYALSPKDLADGLSQDALNSVLVGAGVDLGYLPEFWARKSRREIARGIGLALAASQQFGGPERKLRVREEPGIVGRTAHVLSKRMVVEGCRIPGYPSSWYDEGEGPSFEEADRHLLLNVCLHVFGGEPFEVRAVNCERLDGSDAPPPAQP